MSAPMIAVNREWLDKLQADKAALERRVAELEGALRIYASKSNWFGGFEWDHVTYVDGYTLAAEALAGEQT